MSDIENKILDWASADWIPESKKEEDEFLGKCSDYINKNCKNNPGKLGEWIVCKLIGNCKINEKLECDWLLGQKHILPDLSTEDKVGEVKTLRYYSSTGKRGNQGTGPEKIDSIFRKYDGINKKKMIVLVADQQLEKNGLMYLKAFNDNDYSNNGYMKHIVPYLKDNKFEMISFKQLRDNCFNNL